MRRRTTTMLVTVTYPATNEHGKPLTASWARREVRYLINEGSGFDAFAGELIKVRSVKPGRAVRSANSKPDHLDEALKAIRMVSAIRSFNWNDGDDPEMKAAFEAVDAVLAGRSK